jgi:hypothetical protein
MIQIHASSLIFETLLLIEMRNLCYILIVFLSAFTAVQAQDAAVTYTMGYYKIEITPTKPGFFKRYIMPGKEGVCGLYSSFNKTMYLCDGNRFEVENTDYIYPALNSCCEKMTFMDGPKPYAMFAFDAQIINVDYENNKIYARVDGADIVIETYNKEIDALYKNYFKDDRLNAVRIKLILRNWTYEPESEESYAKNSKKIKRNRWKPLRAKNKEKYMHDSEYMKL